MDMTEQVVTIGGVEITFPADKMMHIVRGSPEVPFVLPLPEYPLRYEGPEWIMVHPVYYERGGWPDPRRGYLGDGYLFLAPGAPSRPAEQYYDVVTAPVLAEAYNGTMYLLGLIT